MQGGGKTTLFGIVMMVLGVLAMATPIAVGASIILMIGILVLVGGIIRLVWAARSAAGGQRNLWYVIGGLMVVAGIMMLVRPDVASGFLTILLAIYFVADGVFEIVAGLRIRPLQGWLWILMGGILSLVLGLLIWQQFPISGALAIGVFIGIKLFLAGLTMVTVGSAVSAAMKQAKGGSVN